MVSESRVPILVFLGLSVLDLGPMYATDRRLTDRRQADRQADEQADRRQTDHRLMLPSISGAGA